MKKIIYRKFLTDCSIFFLICLISTSTIIWVFQAVNYLEIIIDDGRGYDVYLKYSLLNLPKIISRILPFAFFFSFSYVIAKYELNNQLLIFWNFGINKIFFLNFFLIFSLFLLIFQILLTSYVVPKSQGAARSLLRTTNYNFVENFIKLKKFNADVNDLTIYTEFKDQENFYNNIYIKKNLESDNFQTTYAKKGKLSNKNGVAILELYDGETTTMIDGTLTNFSFSLSEFNLEIFSPNTILVKKTQEHLTKEIINCILILTNFNNQKLDEYNYNLNKIKNEIRNCELKNLDNIFSELYKRIIIPFYIPVLMLISLLLIIYSKERVNYSNLRVIIFLTGFTIIIFSESTIRFISSSLLNNLFLVIAPLLLIFFLYFHLFSKFNFNRKTK